MINKYIFSKNSLQICNHIAGCNVFITQYLKSEVKMRLIVFNTLLNIKYIHVNNLLLVYYMECHLCQKYFLTYMHIYLALNFNYIY